MLIGAIYTLNLTNSVRLACLALQRMGLLLIVRVRVLRLVRLGRVCSHMPAII